MPLNVAKNPLCCRGEWSATWGGSECSTITIEGRRRGARPELGQIMSELSDLSLFPNESQEDKGQDLLDLMDSV